MPEKIDAECDLIMKGGITSGVVYPFTVLELAKNYKFRNIGGSSAGAIAAVFAGAAEYRRAEHGGEGGFEATTERVKKLENGVSHLFQPQKDLRRLFDVLKFMSRDKMHPLMAVMRAYWFVMAIVAVGAFFLSLGTFFLPDTPLTLLSLLRVLVAVVAGLIAFAGLLLLVVYGIWRRLQTAIKKNHFGICPGIKQDHSDTGGLIDWLAEGIEEAAHPKPTPNSVTTYGDLAEKKIRVEVMTTNLTEGRPYRLPFWKEEEFCFSKAELKQLLPARVMNVLCNENLKVAVQDGEGPVDLYFLPPAKNFPLILLARLSLSFPGLLSAVPLWKQTDGTWQKHYFSDGGICSNFPMHFFDAPLPERPTFGIRFAEFEKLSQEQKDSEKRAFLATGDTKTDDIESAGKFVSSMFFTAKDWKDNLQTELPGYADRIVEIALKKDEGGFNLWMGEETIGPMFEFGEEAGKVLMDKWAAPGATAFDEHRVTRAVSFVPAVERMLMSFARAFVPVYEHAIQNVDPDGGATISKDDRVRVLLPFMNNLKALGDQALNNYQTDADLVTRTEIPQSLAEIRLNTREGGPEPIPQPRPASAASPTSGDPQIS